MKSFIMKKSILNLGIALNKSEQKEINGGIFSLIQILPCNEMCVTAQRGTKCGTHCPGVCTGNGGFVLY